MDGPLRWFRRHMGYPRCFTYKQVILWKSPFVLPNMGRWQSERPPSRNIFKEAQTVVELFAPSFLFDSLPQYSPKNDRECWGKLSNCLISQGGNSLTKGKTKEKFTKCSLFVKKRCFLHCWPLFSQWQPYIAKYPWHPISPRTPKFEIGAYINDLWCETKRRAYPSAPHSTQVYPRNACKRTEYWPEPIKEALIKAGKSQANKRR